MEMKLLLDQDFENFCQHPEYQENEKILSNLKTLDLLSGLRLLLMVMLKASDSG